MPVLFAQHCCVHGPTFGNSALVVVSHCTPRTSHSCFLLSEPGFFLLFDAELGSRPAWGSLLLGEPVSSSPSAPPSVLCLFNKENQCSVVPAYEVFRRFCKTQGHLPMASARSASGQAPNRGLLRRVRCGLHLTGASHLWDSPSEPGGSAEAQPRACGFATHHGPEGGHAGLWLSPSACTPGPNLLPAPLHCQPLPSVLFL